MYNHQTIEKKWQDKWQKTGLYKTVESHDKPKYYILDMFPYPSGEGLHVGHPKGYVATDVIARFKMMNGFNVLHPMGWDAFGLPAENYAIKTKTHPKIATQKNVQRYKEQLEVLGLTYDWDREINTTDPAYYKWTQWIFLQMFKHGLAYESYEPINWCPSCMTGLANEDLEDGKCERCGSEIEQKPMRQWVLRITDYAEKLLEGLNYLDWEKSMIEMQRNWIGKSEGAEIKFEILNHKSETNSKFKIQKSKFFLNVFTTRPDTIFGATYCVLSPEHKLISELESAIENIEEVKNYQDQARKKTQIERTDFNKEKLGVELKGVKAINPANNEELPIFIADYVLVNYGTGAIMAVPAHDERDFEFAEKYNLLIKYVVEPDFVTALNFCFSVFEKKYVKFDYENIDHWNNLGYLVWYLKYLIVNNNKKTTKELEQDLINIPLGWQTIKNDLSPLLKQGEKSKIGDKIYGLAGMWNNPVVDYPKSDKLTQAYLKYAEEKISEKQYNEI
jgi:leucyl-tRNA synthetase